MSADARERPAPVRVARTALLLLPLQLLARSGEAALPLLLSAWFGRSDATDSFYLAWALVQLLGSLLFSAYQDSALIPILTDARLKTPESLPKLLGSILAHTALVGAALAAISGVVVLAVLRYGHPTEPIETHLLMTVPFGGYLFAMGIRSFFAGCLYAEGRYTTQPLASGAGMAVALSVMAALHERGVSLVPSALLAGEMAATLVFAVVFFGALGRRLVLTLERSAAMSAFARLVSYEVFGGAITRANPAVDQLFAGMAGVVGGGTLLRYSLDIALIPTSLLQAALFPVLLSHFSQHAATRGADPFRSSVGKSVITVSIILVVSSVGLYLVRRPIFELSFLHGRMDVAGVEQMIDIFPYHLMGLVPFGALLVLSRAHIAVKNSAIMIKMGIVNAGANLLLDAALVKPFGLAGIALATSLVHLVIAVLFWTSLPDGVERVSPAAAA
jgi:putative peptidoglycan lipid II flippase